MGTDIGGQERSWIGGGAMIEFLPPRSGAFGESDAPDFVGFDGADTDDFGDEPPRSRWLTALAVIGVTGLLAGGVIAAAPWDDDQAATPSTTTTPPTTTPPTTTPKATTTTEPRLPPGVSADIPGMLLSGPARYTLTWAQSFVDQPEADLGFGDPIEVWMSPDASRSTGRWIVIDSQRADNGTQRIRRNAERVVAGTRPALVIAHPDGVVEIEAHDSEGAQFAVAGFGIGLPELIGIASTVRIDARGVDHGDLLAPGGPFDGLEQRMAMNTAWNPGGFSTSTPDAIASYAAQSDGSWIQVSIDAPDPTTQLLDQLIGLTPVDTSTLSLDGLSGLYRLTKQFDSVNLASSDVIIGLNFVTFALPDRRIVSIGGSLDIDDLLTFAAELELASPEAWRTAVIDSANGVGVSPDRAEVYVEIGGTRLGEWQAQVYGTLGSLQVTISGSYFFTYDSLDHALGARLTIYRSVDRAFLLATNTWPDTGRRVIITQPGLEPQDVSLVSVDDTALHALVVELDPELPYDVQWLDGDGMPTPGPAVAGP